MTYRQVCTAETQAYLNFTQATSHQKPERPADWETSKNWVRTYLNPYREWIGAQIRADGSAYGVAGRPELVADLAWRDASFSHVKNGIYGEMFCAAMIAAAFVEQDPERIVRIGLSEIPRNCRLARAIEQAIAVERQASDQVQLVSRIWEAFNHYHPVHTNNNAALVAAAIIFADGDFDQAIATSVLGGWDTDCNGATVGSIMGAVMGANNLPSRWVEPLNETLYAELTDFIRSQSQLARSAPIRYFRNFAVDATQGSCFLFQIIQFRWFRMILRIHNARNHRHHIRGHAKCKTYSSINKLPKNGTCRYRGGFFAPFL